MYIYMYIYIYDPEICVYVCGICNLLVFLDVHILSGCVYSYVCHPNIYICICVNTNACLHIHNHTITRSMCQEVFKI